MKQIDTEKVAAALGAAARDLLLRVYRGAVLSRRGLFFYWRADGEVVSDSAAQELQDLGLILLLPPGVPQVPLTGWGRNVAERLAA